MEELNILVIDTSNDILKIGLSIEGRYTLVDTANNCRHIENLIPEIDKMVTSLGCDRKMINYIGVCEGPGSFTGIRIGLATAYGLAFGGKIKCFGFSSFDVYKYLLKDSKSTIIPIIDAKKNKFYCSFIKDQSKVEMFDYTIDEINERVLDNSIFTGKDFVLIKDRVKCNNFKYLYNNDYSSKDLLDYSKSLILNGNELIYPEPIYLRKSEAEISLIEAKGKSK